MNLEKAVTHQVSGKRGVILPVGLRVASLAGMRIRLAVSRPLEAVCENGALDGAMEVLTLLLVRWTWMPR